MGSGYGLTGAIDKRIARIQKTLQNKTSPVLEQRLKNLQRLKNKEKDFFSDLTNTGANPTYKLTPTEKSYFSGGAPVPLQTGVGSAGNIAQSDRTGGNVNSGGAAGNMGGGSRQATSAGSTKSGRTDDGWGWAEGGIIDIWPR
jgi:hypothetical protein